VYFAKDEKDQHWKVSSAYRTRDNMVNYCANECLNGAIPAPWWQRSHDIDLIYGVYKHGFGNY